MHTFLLKVRFRTQITDVVVQAPTFDRARRMVGSPVVSCVQILKD